MYGQRDGRSQDADQRFALPRAAVRRTARPGSFQRSDGLCELVRWLAGHGVTGAGMEGTGIYWQAPWSVLDAAGIEVQLYHAQHVRQLRGHKTDVEDSRWLARICQFGLGRSSLVVSEHFRRLRALSRHRRQLVRDRSRVRNRVQKVLDRCGVRIGGILSDVFGVNGRRIIDGLAKGESRQRILGHLTGHVRRKQTTLFVLSAGLSSSDRFMLDSLLAQHDFLQGFDHAAEMAGPEFAATAADDSRHQFSAMDILIETGGDPGAFANAGQFSSRAGLCPGNNESAGKRRSARSVRGNPHLRTVLTECALAASRTRHCQFHGYHKAIHIRRGYKRATVATAHKLARTIHCADQPAFIPGGH